MASDLSDDTITNDLLTELETVTHSNRVRRMVEIGRHSREGDEVAAALLRGLSAHAGFYERMLVLLSCSGSWDGEHVLRSLSDESRSLRGLAIRLTPQVCTDAQVLSALESVPHKAQVVLLRDLLRHKRRNVIDTFLDRLAATDPARRDQLLPFRSSQGITLNLPDASEQFGLNDWARLARLHPDIAFDALQERMAAQSEPDARLLSQVNEVLPALAYFAPDKAVVLAQGMLRYEPPARLKLQRLADRRPGEVADLLLEHEDGGAAHVSLTSYTPRLTKDQLLAILERRPKLLPYPSVWLPRTKPELRRAAYERAGLGWRSKDGILDAEVVKLLPGELRATEARRHLAIPILATRPAQRLPYASFLPWEEAEAVLLPSIRNPDAELRAVALSALIGAARFQREHLADVLTLIRARNNEQDPVRLAMLTALAALPPSRWQMEHLDGLSTVLQDALNAADLSHATAMQAEKLVICLVPFHPGWAAQWLGTLVKSRGQLHFYGLGDRLTDRDMTRIAPSLLPVLHAWETRERERFIVQMGVSLGRRLRVFDGLTRILERLAKSTRQSGVAWQSLLLLKQHRANSFATLVPELLREDASTITVQPVYEHLHRKRQDLLTPFLGHQAYRGRFSTGKTRFVLPILSGFHRWTPSQQEMFAETLTQITRDEARDTPALFQTVKQLAALPAVRPTRLIELADAAMERLAFRDTALRALARLDAGQGIPVLVEALGDIRARVAIYALRSAILEMPAKQALALLQSVPTEKVTVAKEVIRLLGELEMPEVYPLLLEMDGRTLHRDVRVALLRALWDHLEKEETWPVLHRAATNADPAVAAGVIAIPTDRLSSVEQQRLLGLIAELLHHSDSKVRLDTLTRCATLPLLDSRRLLLTRLLELLGSPLPDECTAASRAVFATYAGSTGRDAVAVGEAVATIRSNRRALGLALTTLHSFLIGNRSRLRPAVRAVLDALEGDAITARHRAELAVAALPWDEVAAYLLQLAGTNELHAEALLAAVRAIEARWSHAGMDTNSGIDTLEAALMNSADERLRRLAFAALIAQAAGTYGWTPELRSRLEGYRNDLSPLVAAAAQFTLPPPDGLEGTSNV